MSEAAENPFGTAWAAVGELEGEYLRVGAEKCNCMQERTQLTACLLLGVRSLSLIRAMYRLLEPNFLDAFDAVRRAFMESWALQFDLRLVGSDAKAQKWFDNRDEAWKADYKKIEGTIEAMGGGKSGINRLWAELSSLSHPTYEATSNSCAVATTVRGMNENGKMLAESLSHLAHDYLGLVNYQLFASLATNERFIDLGIVRDRIPVCMKLYGETAVIPLEAKRDTRL